MTSSLKGQIFLMENEITLAIFATQDEVKQLKEQLKSLKAELASLKQILGLKNVLLGGLFSHPFTDSGYSDAIAETSSYSSSYVSSTTPKSVYSTCSCGSQRTSASSSSDFCSRPDDLSQMSGPLTEESILKVLHQRWKFGECQTRIGPVLLTFNPHRGIPIQQAFQYSQLGQNLPLSQLACNVLNNLHDKGLSQAIILCGESGSGKTYASQLLLRQIYNLKGQGSDSQSFKLVTAASHVLRALSTVKTPANPSATRMGCTTEIGISSKGLDRVRFHPMWIDQCRVVRSLSDESNFHILKQMIVGLTPEEKVKLHLKGCSASNMRCLSSSESDDVDHLRIQFECFRSALSTLGIEFMDVMRVMSAVLLLRNLEFQDNGGYELDMNGNEEIKFVSSLLGISGVSLYHALTSRTHIHKDKAIKTLCDAKKANQNAESLAKALYCRTVLAIIKRINSVCRFEHHYATLTAPGEDCGISNCSSCVSLPQGSPTPSVSSYASHTTSTATLTAHVSQTIQIVDMPGFQSSACNRLGQLLSNLCSERLQQFYNQSTIQSSLKACSADKIQCDVNITYNDNTPLVNLIYDQGKGLLGILDKTCMMQRVSDAKSFLQGVTAECTSDRLKCCKSESFIINHSNGPVEYNASDFVWTNRDVIGDEVVGLFSRKSCNFGFVTHLFIPELRLLKKTRSPGLLFRICPPPPSENLESESENISSFSCDFRQRLETMLETVQETDRHFVFCVKTNDKQSANQFEMEAVQRQVRALQIVPTVHLMAAGYPHHMTFDAFIQRYGCLIDNRNPFLDKEKEQCVAILENLLQRMNESKMPYITTRWTFGSSNIFLSDETFRFLNHFLSHQCHMAAVVIQSYVRRWICMQWWKAQCPPVAKKKKAKKHVQIREPVYECIPVSPVLPMERDEKSEADDDPEYMEASPVIMKSHSDNRPMLPPPVIKGPPPPLPRNHPCQETEVTSCGEFPQTRMMKCDYPENEPFLKAGEAVLVTGRVMDEDTLYVEHGSCLFRIPGDMTEVKVNGMVLGTKL
ncbi:Unconventional myosin-Ib [Holothuria leucospilota]|uniref:Unconventional myosin-Ib n=1 Tax=Holothuria leucospilota TaxID=206669 RepID=A0A9Q1C475_HOLLE|nr:Unconventional myosin-Ib [Holothuria leucospilota]